MEGGVNLFAYVANNPTNLTDASGEFVLDVAFGGGGALVGLGGQVVGDIISGSWSGWERYVAATIGGVAGGEALLYTGNPYIAGAIGGATTNLVAQGLEMLSGKRRCLSWRSLATDIAIGTATGLVPGTGKMLPGITKGRGSYIAVAKRMSTQLARGQIQNVSAKTATKMMVGNFMAKGIIPGAGAAGAAGAAISGYFDDCNCK